jgi:hypothetical protein
MIVLQWLAVFGQISLHWQLISLSVCRRPTGFWGGLYAQICSEFYLFYFIFSKVKMRATATLVNNGDRFWAVDKATHMLDKSNISDNLQDLAISSEAYQHSLKQVLAAITPINNKANVHIKLYNLGTTWHISPYQGDFILYQALQPPLLLNTTNSQQFPSLGVGTIIFRYPMGMAPIPSPPMMLSMPPPSPTHSYHSVCWTARGTMPISAREGSICSHLKVYAWARSPSPHEDCTTWCTCPTQPIWSRW